MNVSGNNALPFDADCYAILCLERKPLFQRNSSESADNRKDAGVRKTFPGGKGTGPFRNPTQAGVNVPPGGNFVSPEEFFSASTMQGGDQAYLFPVTEASQRSQGGTINDFYRRYKVESAHKNPNAKSWYQITGWSGQLGPYCQALQNNGGNSNRNDPICKKDGNGKGSLGFDVGEYVYYYDGQSYHKPQGSK
ncbi:uncharacterized protein ACHE_40725A [Aspergillus chevalieri]|uniref:Deoxyribonuclease NucA/NucB domain-containing protein n=1 Tax=Aspergillus chevalieri TaxID=182096 RepID=A0A7R7ZP22_ASPCH|nr:uncharacterized protein ACHE_40725A [Aspergillus chevalieri]BCR88161.1 hypothetical protein ACHE_40725A [Aspergillus chevalieri]